MYTRSPADNIAPEKVDVLGRARTPEGTSPLGAERPPSLTSKKLDSVGCNIDWQQRDLISHALDLFNGRHKRRPKNIGPSPYVVPNALAEHLTQGSINKHAIKLHKTIDVAGTFNT